MSFRKLFSAVSLWSISTRRSSEVSVFSDIQNDQWPLGNSSVSVPCTSTSNAWPAREDSFPRHRMTPSPEIVLKQGFLHKKRERSSAASLKRPWQSGYFVLKKSPGYSGLLLDEYRDASLRVAKQTLFLDTVKHVGPVNTSRSKRYAFQVVVLGRSPLFFACDNEFLRSEWISVFAKYTDETADLPSSHGRISPEGGPSASARQSRQPQTNSVYVDMKGEESNGRLSISDCKGYEVAIQKTPLSEANNLQGSFLLRITKSRIYLKQLDRKEDVLSWPLTQLRGFKSQPNQQQIILETGRRCHFGKGRLIFRTKYGESIINDIRGAISTDSLSSGNSSDSETEQAHPPVTRSLSDQKCNVTVSVRPRRMHSERVINQVAVGRSPNGKASGKTSPSGPNAISPNFLRNTSSNCLRLPNSTTDTSTEDVFTFEDKLGLFKETTKTENIHKTVNWKTSTTFSKTMIDSKSDNENEASSNDCEDDTEFHPYIDIIPDDETEKPLGSDEASTLLAQVVADLTEPQKRNCFIKSKSTGGITVRPVDPVNEIRRASEPAVGSRDYIASPTSENDAQGSPLNTHWKLRLEKINEVSFTEATESDRQNDQHLSPKMSPRCDCMPSVEADRPRSLSELVANELEMPTLVKSTKKRSKTLLGITHSHVGSSLTDLSNTTISKHKGLRPALSHSPSSAFSHQLAKDPSSIGFAQGMGRIPSFPKSRVVKSVDTVRVLENTRTKMNLNSLPPEFHATPPNESFETDVEKPDISSPISPTFTEPLPPRPPKDRPIETKNWKKSSQSSPPPLPVRSPSLPITSTQFQQGISPSHFSVSPPQPIISPREKVTRFNSSFESTAKPYANTPPKVQPRIPNAMPLQATTADDSNENISPPPRPPKPESISVALRQSTMDQFVPSPGSLRRRAVSEKRADSYPWETNGLREGSPQLERVKSPIVMITPPRSPTLERPPKGLLRGVSLSDSDITEALERQLKFNSTSGRTQNNPPS